MNTDKAREALSFTIDGPEQENRVLRWNFGGCRPASASEIELWDALAALDAPAVEPVTIPVEQQNARFAIDGAISYGHMGINKPPSPDHWLMPYWEMGYDLSAAPSNGAPRRDSIIEECAKVCDQIENGEYPDGDAAAGLAWECAVFLRSLKSKQEGK